MKDASTRRIFFFKFLSCSRAFGTALLVWCSLSAPLAHAQAFPSKPIRLISPYPAGGGNDLLSRAIASKLGPRLGQQVFVENKPGANSIIATESLAKSAPDGYTLILVPSSHAINQSLYAKLPYDAVRDFTPVSLTGSTPFMMAVPASSPYKTLQEILAAARAKPGVLTYSTAGSGSTGHLTAVLLSLSSGVTLQHVPYKGTAPALTALLGEQVTMSFTPPTVFLPHIRAGKLRAIGMSSAEPSAQAPEIPTIASQGLPGFVSTVWYGILAPAHTPRPIVDRLNAEISAVLKDPEIIKVLTGQSIDPLTSTPDEFAKLIAGDVEKWAKVVKESGAKPD